MLHMYMPSTACAPQCRPRPGYPSRRWKAQQAFCIGVSAADGEWLMMWDDEDSEELARWWRRCRLLRKCPGPGETIARSQPSGRVDHSTLRHGSLYIIETARLGGPARWPVSRVLSRLSPSPHSSAVVIITQSPSHPETLYTRYRLRLDSSAAFASWSVC